MTDIRPAQGSTALDPKEKTENRLSYPFIGVPSMAGICMIGMYVSGDFMPKANYPKRKRNAVAD